MTSQFSISMSLCNVCRLDLPISSFDKNKNERNGICRTCKDCRKIQRSKQREQLSSRTTIKIPEINKCQKCKNTLPYTDFSKNRSKTTGLSDYCKRCAALTKKAKYEEYSNRHTIDEPATKKCCMCNKILPNDSFPKLKGSPTGLYQNCKKCQIGNNLRQNYGISPKEYESLVKIQKGRCAGCNCSSKKRLHVDHDHNTGKIRSLLCMKCNCVIGMIKEDPKVCDAIVTYLSKDAKTLVDILERKPQEDFPKTRSFAKYIKLTERQKDLIYDSQNQRCAICGIHLKDCRRPCLDHNHKTGLIRGYLCLNCNSALGLLTDNIATVISLKRLLLKYQNQERC